MDQLCYILTRLEDIQALTTPIQSSQNVAVDDRMRFFHADHPEQAAECGQQDGGHYRCCLCPEKVTGWTDLIKCYRAPRLSLQDRIKMVC